MQLLADEATRQRQLVRAKRRATLLLVAAVVVYVVSRALVASSPYDKFVPHQ